MFNLKKRQKGASRQENGTTFYLADTENIARDWYGTAMNAKPGDTILLFYSKHVGSINMRLFGEPSRKGVRFRFIECETGDDAMDFQIATELGSLVSANPKASFIILSKDTGFDVVIHYWAKRGIDIRRIAPEHVSAVLITEKQIKKPSPRPTAKQAVKPAPKPVQPTPKPKGPSVKPGMAKIEKYKRRVAGLQMNLTSKELTKTVNMLLHAMQANTPAQTYATQLNQSFGEKRGSEIYDRTRFLLTQP